MVRGSVNFGRMKAKVSGNTVYYTTSPSFNNKPVYIIDNDIVSKHPWGVWVLNHGGSGYRFVYQYPTLKAAKEMVTRFARGLTDIHSFIQSTPSITLAKVMNTAYTNSFEDAIEKRTRNFNTFVSRNFGW